MMAGGNGTVLEAVAISKAFGHVQALDAIDFSLSAGEIVALVGDNGAGKSTLIKILSGVYEPDEGEIRLAGAPVSFASPADSRKAGVATVYQDLALVDTRDVAANLYLGQEFTRGPFINRRRILEEARVRLDELGIKIPSVRVPVGMLSGGQRQAVAVARAIVQGGRIVIMDEPTAALGVAESERVLGLAKELRDGGKSVILVSHNLQHVWAVADRIVVLSHGHLAGDVRKGETSIEEVVRLIVFGSLQEEQREDAILHERHLGGDQGVRASGSEPAGGDQGEAQE